MIQRKKDRDVVGIINAFIFMKIPFLKSNDYIIVHNILIYALFQECNIYIKFA